jgi:hypothetical protein
MSELSSYYGRFGNDDDEITIDPSVVSGLEPKEQIKKQLLKDMKAKQQTNDLKQKTMDSGGGMMDNQVNTTRPADRITE